MRQVLLQVLIFSCITATACFATPPNLRNEAISALERIQKSAPPDSLYDEYNSIIETFSKAEQLWEQSRPDDAEKLFRLTLLKTSLYEKNLDSLLSEPAANSTSPSSKTTPAETLSATIPSHGPDPPHSPPTGASPEANPAPKNQTLVTSTARSGDNSESTAETRRMIVGNKMIYTVRKGDTLRLIGAKFGVSWKFVAQNNRLNPKKHLKPGQKLTINTRKIIPKTVQDGIVINIPDRTLYFFKNGILEKAVPVGLGMTTLNDVVVWQTPTGKFRILSKIKNPAWHVPPSIQKEMEQKGKEVKTIVPPGEDNPLGKYALKTSLPGILIHSTIVPESIYTFSSHGCIRVFPSNMEAIFNEVVVNTRGEIIYQPVKLALTENGLIFLEVHRDIYDRHKNLQALAKRLITKNKLEKLVDWDKVHSSLRRKSGVPEEITGLAPPKQMITSSNPTSATILPNNNSDTASPSMAIRPVSN
jgi:L,D-transpeptidase ErfK/SrfK